MLSQAGMAVGSRLVALCSSSEARWLWPLYIAARPHILQSQAESSEQAFVSLGSCTAPVGHDWSKRPAQATNAMKEYLQATAVRKVVASAMQSLAVSCDESPMLNRKGLEDSFSTTTAASTSDVRSLMYLQTIYTLY